MTQTESEVVEIAGTKMLRHRFVIKPHSRETFSINDQLIAIETSEGSATLVWAEVAKDVNSSNTNQ